MKNFISHAMRAAVILAGVAGFTLVAEADPLQQIKDRKKVQIAIDLSVPPFGLTDSAMQPQGSDVEVARMLAQDLGVELEIVQVSGPNRIPFLLTRKADMVISSFSITPERAKVIAFSHPYRVNQLVIGGPKSTAVRALDDLVGKRVGVVRGNLQDLELTAHAPKGTMLVRYDDDATANTALVAGQVDAISAPSNTVLTLAQKHPNKELEVKMVVKVQPLAIGLRKEDETLRTWVNEWVDANLKNGRLADAYQKWMQIPLPDMAQFAQN